MHVKLVIVGGKASKSRVSVKLPTVIGRSREADLTVAHPMISRKHCELYEVNGLVMIRDLGSLNGLFIAGSQVSEAALHPNAEFTVGPLTFRVEYQYEGELLAGDATTINEVHEDSESPDAPAGAESGGRPAGFDVADPPQGLPVADVLAAEDQPEPRGPDAYDHPTPVDQPGIAPADLAAWEPDGTEPLDEPPGRQAIPRPPDFFGVGGQQDPAETQTKRPPSPPPDDAVPKTTSFEPQEPDEAEKSEGPADEASGGSTTEDVPPAGQDEDKGQFDLSLPPKSEEDDSCDREPPDDLSEFLRGLG